MDMDLVGFILGVIGFAVAIVSALVPYGQYPLFAGLAISIASIVLSSVAWVKARRQDESTKIARFGIVVGAIATALSILLVVIFISVFVSQP
jgi:hypothetical protein